MRGDQRLALSALIPAMLVASLLAHGPASVTHPRREAAVTPAPSPEPPAPFLTYDEGALRYTYHVISGQEGLFAVGTDPDCLANLADERPDDVRRLRKLLERKLHVVSLDDYRESQIEKIKRLHALGYL